VEYERFLLVRTRAKYRGAAILAAPVKANYPQRYLGAQRVHHRMFSKFPAVAVYLRTLRGDYRYAQRYGYQNAGSLAAASIQLHICSAIRNYYFRCWVRPYQSGAGGTDAPEMAQETSLSHRYFHARIRSHDNNTINNRDYLMPTSCRKVQS